MAQPGEARATPANARVGTIQIWMEGIAFGCMALGLGILLFSAVEMPNEGLQALVVAGFVIAVLGAMLLLTGRGILLLMRPHDVRGALRSEAEHLGGSRIYAFTLIWAGIGLAVAWSFLVFYHAQLWLDWVALFGLGPLSILPLVFLRIRAWWRSNIR